MIHESKKLNRAALERVAETFSLFSEPTRLAILQELKGGRQCVGQLVEVLGVSQAHVSRQLGILHAGGLLLRERQGAQVYYSIQDPLVEILCGEVCLKLSRDAKERASVEFGV